MFIRRWFKKKRFVAERKAMEQKGTWGDNDETIEVLLDYLEKESYTGISVRKLELTSTQVFQSNVDLLIQQLQKATHVITQRIGFGEAERPVLTTQSMDNYLTTTNNFTVSPQEATSKLYHEARRYLLALRIAVSELDGTDQESMVVYYRRMTTNIVIDLRSVLQTFSLIVGLG